jgi:hypothetical protein
MHTARDAATLRHDSTHHRRYIACIRYVGVSMCSCSEDPPCRLDTQRLVPISSRMLMSTSRPGTGADVPRQTDSIAGGLSPEDDVAASSSTTLVTTMVATPWPCAEAPDVPRTTMVHQYTAVCCRRRLQATGTWLIVDPFLTSWLRAQRRKTTHKKALLTRETFVRGRRHVQRDSQVPVQGLSVVPPGVADLELPVRRVWAQRYTSLACELSQQGTATRSVRRSTTRCTRAYAVNRARLESWSRTSMTSSWRSGTSSRFQLDVPLGHCIAEKYVAEDDDAVDAAIREVVLMRL